MCPAGDDARHRDEAIRAIRPHLSGVMSVGEAVPNTDPVVIVGSAKQWLRQVAPGRGTLRKDLLAGLPGAISAVPDGMASSVLVGVNPVHGLYASIFGPIGGGLTASTHLMVI